MADLYGAIQQQQTQPQRKLNPTGSNLYGDDPAQPQQPQQQAAQEPQRVTATPLQAAPQQPSPQPPAPASQPAPPAADMTPGQAAAAGLGWVPRDHPMYGQPGYVGSTPQSGGGGGTGTPPAVPGVPGNVAPELKNPTAAPTPTVSSTPAPQVTLGSTVDAPQGQPAAQQTPQQQMQGMLRTSIMGLLNTNPNAVSLTDADIAPQSQAFRAAAERSEAKRRAETVHQAQRGGWGNSGGLDQRLDALSQQTGQAIGANDAALLTQKQDARRQQLQQAIASASQLGMADEANNLSRQLANLDASIQTRGQDIGVAQMGTQRDLANLDASTRLYLGDLSAQMQREGYGTQERLARLDAELRRYGIDTQGRLGELDAAIRGQLGNRQIDLGYDQLGVDVARTRAQMDRDAVMAGLGG